MLTRTRGLVTDGMSLSLHLTLRGRTQGLADWDVPAGLHRLHVSIALGGRHARATCLQHSHGLGRLEMCQLPLHSSPALRASARCVSSTSPSSTSPCCTCSISHPLLQTSTWSLAYLRHMPAAHSVPGTAGVVLTPLSWALREDGFMLAL